MQGLVQLSQRISTSPVQQVKRDHVPCPCDAAPAWDGLLEPTPPADRCQPHPTDQQVRCIREQPGAAACSPHLESPFLFSTYSPPPICQGPVPSCLPLKPPVTAVVPPSRAFGTWSLWLRSGERGCHSAGVSPASCLPCKHAAGTPVCSASLYTHGPGGTCPAHGVCPVNAHRPEILGVCPRAQLKNLPRFTDS